MVCRKVVTLRDSRDERRAGPMHLISSLKIGLPIDISVPLKADLKASYIFDVTRNSGIPVTWL
jgi:hypothetical protein